MVDKQPEVLAVIPARGGSKSVPRKNIKLLGRHPLIAYSIAAGTAAHSVTRVIVSTDDQEIADIAKSYGAEVPFLRPPELAQDDTPDLPVFQHALRWLEEREQYRPRIVVQLRPTSPVRPIHCVDQAVTLLMTTPQADSVRTVVTATQMPYKMWRLKAEGQLEPLLTCDIPEAYNAPRQKLPQTYWQSGHVDVMRVNTIWESRSMSGKTIYPLLVDSIYNADIDSPLDWARAEWLLKQSDQEIVKPLTSSPDSPTDSLATALGTVRLLVLDFDGVMTDNRVLVDQDGRESVFCNRADGLGLERLIASGVEVFVLSTERNGAVAARCRKLKIDYLQACDYKIAALQTLVRNKGLSREQVAYLGNDVNDLGCMRWVGLPAAVADAAPEVLAVAMLITRQPGGRGAVRELTDAILQASTARRNHPPALVVS